MGGVQVLVVALASSLLLLGLASTVVRAHHLSECGLCEHLVLRHGAEGRSAAAAVCSVLSGHAWADEEGLVGTCKSLLARVSAAAAASSAAEEVVLAAAAAAAQEENKRDPAAAAALARCVGLGACSAKKGVAARPLESPPRAGSPLPDLRVARAMGPRGYAKMRVSVISNSSSCSSSSSSSSSSSASSWPQYSEPFRYRWTDKALATGIVDVVPGKPQTVDLGQGQSARVFLPAPRSGIRGLLLADPCWDSRWVPCVFGERFDTTKRIPGILNAVFDAPRALEHLWSFWMVLGDNFYDRTGELTEYMFERLSQNVKQATLYSVVGNHDLWVFGFPDLADEYDQYGLGNLQYYGQDSVAALTAAGFPYNFSVNPDKEPDVTQRSPAPQNHVQYHANGNVGFMTYAGGSYEFAEYTPMFQDACAWLHDQFTQKEISIVFLLEHWDVANTGCDDTMTIQAVHRTLSTDARFPGCNALAEHSRDQGGLFRFITGHQHVNQIKGGGAGVQVAGWGMPAGLDSNNGLTILDTTGGTAKVLYFPFGDTFDPFAPDRYDATLACLKQKGALDLCYSLAETWINVTLPW